MNTRRTFPLALMVTGSVGWHRAVATSRVAPCYVAVSIVVVDTGPRAGIRRIVSTGVRRYEDLGGGTQSLCLPTERRAILAGERAVLHRVDSTGVASPFGIDRVVLRGTNAETVVAGLVALAARAREGSAPFARIESVRLVGFLGREPDEVALPSQACNDVDRAACLADNAFLERDRASFRWVC